jgi:N utilization substance protein B
MSRRRKARELALQTLYAEQVSGTDWKVALKENAERRRSSAESVTYAGELIRHVVTNKDHLDALISDTLENWKLDRVSIVDRTILRIALAELLYVPRTPTKVIIDEAIEIAYNFSSRDAGRFINGILDRLAKEVRAH